MTLPFASDAERLRLAIGSSARACVRGASRRAADPDRARPPPRSMHGSRQRRRRPRAEAVLGDRLGGSGHHEQASRAAATDACDDVELEHVAEQPRPALIPGQLRLAFSTA
jgi:hypothetical protein